MSTNIIFKASAENAARVFLEQDYVKDPHSSDCICCPGKPAVCCAERRPDHSRRGRGGSHQPDEGQPAMHHLRPLHDLVRASSLLNHQLKP